MKSTFICFFSLLITGCVVVSCGSSQDGASQKDFNSELTVPLPLADTLALKKSFDTLQLGSILSGEVLEGAFTIHNVSESPLVILQIITGCGCTTVSYETQPIAPDEERLVRYRFDSNGRFGAQFQPIEIITSDRDVATVYVRADVQVRAQ